MNQITTGTIASVVGGTLHGDEGTVITGVASLENAGEGDLSFVANTRYLAYLGRTRAGCILVGAEHLEAIPPGVPAVLVRDPHVALYHALRLLYPPSRVAGSIHPTAAVDPTAEIASDVEIGAHSVVAAGARIGARTRVGAHAVVGEGSVVGEECLLHPHSTVHAGVLIGNRCILHSGARVGREGFGFVWLDGGHRRVPQVGGCILEDDVEIGANSNVDRGSVGDTVIGAGTKIDSLVHIGHNVKLGRHVLLIAQVGISGSTTVGDGAILGGQVGVGGHLSIGAGARIGAQGGVTADIPAGEVYSGYPARPHREALRAQAALFKLPALVRRLRELERLTGADSAKPGQDPEDRAAVSQERNT